jgi:hypothetical protein
LSLFYRDERKNQIAGFFKTTGKIYGENLETQVLDAGNLNKAHRQRINPVSVYKNKGQSVRWRLKKTVKKSSIAT